MAAERRRVDDLRRADADARHDHHVLERRAADSAEASSTAAIQNALASLDRRLDGLNELRSGVATKDALDAVADSGRRTDRLVYIATGIAIAASVAIPLLLGR